MSGVTITPGGTSRLLARQVEVMRQQAMVAMRKAVHDTAEEYRRVAPGSIGEHIREKVGSGPGVVTGMVVPQNQRVARFVDEGTGIYVEHHQPIRPLAARRLANPRAALKLKDGRVRRSVRGQRPQHIRQRALDASIDTVERSLEQPAITVPQHLH